MRKRFFAWLLSFAMILSLLPTTVLAAAVMRSAVQTILTKITMAGVFRWNVVHTETRMPKCI